MQDDCPDTPRVVVSCTKVLFLTITCVVTGHLSNEPPQQFNFPFDSVVLGDDAFECAYLVDVAGEGSLRFAKLGLEIGKRKHCGQRSWGYFWKVLIPHRRSNGR